VKDQTQADWIHRQIHTYTSFLWYL